MNWNGAEHLPDCLDSLASQSHEALDILVVDNASGDDSEAVVRDRDAGWLELPANLGLAAAFNAGADVARGEFLLFLNNDMRFAPDFVEGMVSCLEGTERCGAVDAIQRDWDDGEIVHAATVLSNGKVDAPLPRWRFDNAAAPAARETVCPSGANTLIAADTFRAIGGWDRKFFAGYEDVDLGWRLWLAGRPVVVTPAAVCWHRVSASSVGEGIGIRAEAAIHGPVLFALKHAPAEVAAMSVARAVARCVLVAIVGPSPRRATHFGAVRQIARHLPSALRWRRATYKAAGVTPRAHWRLLESIGS